MGDDDVPRRERRRHLPKNVQKRIVVGNKNLNDIAHFGELGRRAHEIRHRPRIPIPNKDVETLAAQIVGNTASNNAESDYANVFSSTTRHGDLAALWPLLSLR